MSLAATHDAPLLRDTAKRQGFFGRTLEALMRARAREAERIIADVMTRRGLHLVDGEWKPDTRL